MQIILSFRKNMIILSWERYFFMGGGRSVAVGDNSFTICRGTDAPEVVKTVTLDQEIQSVFHSDEYIGLILLNREKSGYELRLYNRER